MLLEELGYEVMNEEDVEDLIITIWRESASELGPTPAFYFPLLYAEVTGRAYTLRARGLDKNVGHQNENRAGCFADLDTAATAKERQRRGGQGGSQSTRDDPVAACRLISRAISVSVPRVMRGQ